MKTIAIFPGSFDPFTIGHADIVRRALQLFDRIIIAVGYNAAKTSATAVADRVAAIERWASQQASAPSATLPSVGAPSAPLPSVGAPSAGLSSVGAPSAGPLSVDAVNNAAIQSPRIKVVAYTGLTADLAAREGARFLLRGVRSVKDFEYERDMAAVNRALSEADPTVPSLDTVLLIADPRYAHISSSLVRELASYGRDITPYLP